MKDRICALLDGKLEGEEVDLEVRRVEVESHGRKKWWFWVHGRE